VKRLTLLLLVSGCCSVVTADEPIPPTPVPAPAKITIPDVSTIPRDTMLVISADKPLIILQAPDTGILKLTKVRSPLSVFGRFADGDGSSEFRAFDDPYLWVVTGAKAGTTELILIESGIESADQVVRRSLTISGIGPNPPPGPGPGPEPGPGPKAELVSIAIVEDTMQRSTETAILMNRLTAWTEFVDAGNDWRPYDLTTPEAKGKEAIAELGSITAPAIVIRDKTTRRVIHKGPLPATFADLQKLIGGLTGG
jgi:hypothetical protein